MSLKMCAKRRPFQFRPLYIDCNVQNQKQKLWWLKSDCGLGDNDNNKNNVFLHDQPRISPWIKVISNELNITFHVITSQLSGHCDVINNRLWRHQHNGSRVTQTQKLCVKIVALSSFMDSLCRVRNKTIYSFWWRTVYVPTRVLFWWLFSSLLRNSGNKQQNNPLVSA